MGAPPREKVSKRFVSSLARCEAISTSANVSCNSGCGGAITLAMARLPTITVSKLLKSWAIPPARSANDSSFCAFRSSASISFVVGHILDCAFDRCDGAGWCALRGDG